MLQLNPKIQIHSTVIHLIIHSILEKPSLDSCNCTDSCENEELNIRVKAKGCIPLTISDQFYIFSIS